LETSSLAAEVDAIDPEAGKVTLMTLHAAKGLEFPVVFVIGIEQNLIPHERSLQDNNIRELEEERRLLFVGMTRAQHELYLTLTRMREIRGRQLDSIPSMFLSEMDLVRNSLEVPPDEDSQVPREERPAARSEALAKTFERQGRPLLTTGANLLNGHGQPVEVPQGFQVGMLVRHPREGLGRVVEVGIGGARRTVTVEFENGERASFIANKCPLQPVGTR
jgi:DNA helicase-2/ATP-dependent DNA helicase PcrA